MLPPLAIPVAIRSSDLVNSPTASITPPTSSPHQKHPESHMGHSTDVNQSQSPPLSPQSQMDRKALTRIASPYANGRDYTFNHFHTQQPQVRLQVKTRTNGCKWTCFALAFQLSQFNVWRCNKSNKLKPLLNSSYHTKNPCSMEQPFFAGRRFHYDDSIQQQSGSKFSHLDGRRSSI